MTSKDNQVVLHQGDLYEEFMIYGGLNLYAIMSIELLDNELETVTKCFEDPMVFAGLINVIDLYREELVRKFRERIPSSHPAQLRSNTPDVSIGSLETSFQAQRSLNVGRVEKPFPIRTCDVSSLQDDLKDQLGLGLK